MITEAIDNHVGGDSRLPSDCEPDKVGERLASDITLATHLYAHMYIYIYIYLHVILRES